MSFFPCRLDKGSGVTVLNVMVARMKFSRICGVEVRQLCCLETLQGVN
jgi:hypothetical protein